MLDVKNNIDGRPDRRGGRAYGSRSPFRLRPLQFPTPIPVEIEPGKYFGSGETDLKIVRMAEAQFAIAQRKVDHMAAATPFGIHEVEVPAWGINAFDISR